MNVVALAGIGIFSIALFFTPSPFRTRPKPIAPPFPKEFTWGITWHPDFEKERSGSWKGQLDLVQDLGVGLLRFDVPWHALEPKQGQFSGPELEYYRGIVASCRSHGEQVTVDLGGYPAWSMELLNRDPEAFFVQYRHYIGAVVAEMGSDVSYYQLGNEFNTLHDPVPAKYDSRVFREARQELDLYKLSNPKCTAKTVINVCDSFYIPWKAKLEHALDEASSSIDVIGYDYYPGTYSNFNDWAAWGEISYLSGLMRKYGKDGGICETGCPTFFSEKRQAQWISESLRGMMNAIAASPVKERFRFAILYSLSDTPKGAFWMPPTEATFGLLGEDGHRKLGYAAFKDVITETRAAQRY